MPTPTQGTRLRPGSRVAVIGGGPAGSFFALHALHFARQAGLDLRVTIFEPRDFHEPGPSGCNMCAGLIPDRVLRELGALGVSVPERVIRARIERYVFHTAAGEIELCQPDADGGVVSVYRGQGPACAAVSSGSISFDGFLLDEARARGAEVVRERVEGVELRPSPRVKTVQRTFAAELIVLATGVNGRAIRFPDLNRRLPPRERMEQRELCPRTKGAGFAPQEQDRVDILLPRDGSISFGTLVPKGACLNVSLLGPHLRRRDVERFLQLPDVQRLLSQCPRRVCRCRPRIAVGAGKPLYADRFVSVGDAGITRLYKNGIGSALRTARGAARTAVERGVGARDFRRHYAPLCREISFDNLAGRFLFAFTRVFQHHRCLTRPHLQSIAAEQALPPNQRPHSRLLWGMFTGVYPYRRLLKMACHPRLHARLFRFLVSHLILRRVSHPAQAALHPSLQARGVERS